MRAVHFGAGNIGRRFIGEVLAADRLEITFANVNHTTIDVLDEREEYEIELVDESREKVTVKNVKGINNQTNPEKVIQEIAEADLVTTAIGPNILPFIAELTVKGIQEREKEGSTTSLDIIACENMIGSSAFLEKEVYKYLPETPFTDKYVGFPNAAVDRIVPLQHHEDPLFVQMELFKEWVIDDSQRKNKKVQLKGVLYVGDLEPYIERKLFSVNANHATVAYTGVLLDYQTIDEAMQDALAVAQLKSVLQEAGSLLIAKWEFDAEQHHAYIEKIIHHFQNENIFDVITRAARTPSRRLGYQERFTRPVRKLQEHNLTCPHLTATMGIIFNYYDPEDKQSRQLHEMKIHENLEQLIQEVTGINDPKTIRNIKQNVNRYTKQVT